jgi:Copper type II ascorbate-dependent monooxygenase, C-terminal domain
VIDPDTGVRYYYTTNLREHNMGVAVFGDVIGAQYDSHVGDGLYMEYTYNCPASCSSSVLTQNVTFLFLGLHAHQRARALRVQTARDGMVVHTGRADFFTFAQQGAQVVQGDPITVQPGDTIDVSCTYESDPDLLFGLASYQEMCMSYIIYYPKQKYLDTIPWLCGPGVEPFFPCVGTYTAKTLASESEINRAFGTTSIERSTNEALCGSDTCEMLFGFLQGTQLHGYTFEQCIEVCSMSTLFTSWALSSSSMRWGCGKCE